jgi:uncharacterized membrane-anchored protein
VPDIPSQPKREWFDARERICAGSIVVYGDLDISRIHVNELPKEVYAIAKASSTDMIELHYYFDPAIEAYVNKEKIIAIEARWDFAEDH